MSEMLRAWIAIVVIQLAFVVLHYWPKGPGNPPDWYMRHRSQD